MGHRRVGVGVALCGVAFASAGCLIGEPRDTSGVRIVNASSETVTVAVLHLTAESDLTTIVPGESSIENNMLNREEGCTRFAMVARTEDGREVDRRLRELVPHSS